MPAHVVVRADALLPVPDQDDAFPGDLEKPIVARLLELRCVRREYPVIPKDALAVTLEYRGVRIEGTVE